MGNARRPLRQIVLELELATDLQISEALKVQREKGGSLARLLVDLGYVRQEDMLLALGAQARMELVDLDRVDVPVEVVARVPASIARAYRVVPVRFAEGALVLALPDPLAADLLSDLRAILGCEVEGAVAGEASIARALDRLYPEKHAGPQELAEELARLVEQGGGSPPHGKTATFRALVDAWIDKVLLWTQAQQATDVTFELEGNSCRVLYRVEGLSRPIALPEAGVGPHVLSRLREIAHLTDEDPLGSMGQLEWSFGEDKARYRATLEKVGSVERITLHRLQTRVPVAASHGNAAVAEAPLPECEGRSETRLTGFLFGALSEQEMEENERHVRRCPACRVKLQRVRERLSLLTDWAAPPAPEKMTENVLAKATSWKRTARWLRHGIALLVIAFCGFLLWVAYRIAENRMERKDIEALSRAIHHYRNEVGKYPTGSSADLLAALGANAQNGQAYFTPRGDQVNARGELTDRWGRPIVFRCPGRHNEGLFDLLSLGRDGVDSDGGGDDIDNWE